MPLTQAQLKTLLPAQKPLDELRTDEQYIVAGMVVQMSRYDIDAQNRGGSIYLLKPSDGESADMIGLQIIKIRMPFELFEFVQDKVKAGDYPLPANYRILCEMRAGGGQRAVTTAVMVEYAPKETEWFCDQKIEALKQSLLKPEPKA